MRNKSKLPVIPTKRVESKGRTFKLRLVVTSNRRGRVPTSVYEKLIAQVTVK